MVIAWSSHHSRTQGELPSVHFLYQSMLLVQFFELFKSGIISYINLLFHSHQVILRMFRTVRNVVFERLFPNLKEQHYMFSYFQTTADRFIQADGT